MWSVGKDQATGVVGYLTLRAAILVWKVATRAASLAAVGALAVDIALVETGMVENGF
jgi:hypothetical protein